MLPAKITRLLLTAGTLRLLLPQWMRLPLTLWRYRHFFAEGIRSLLAGRLGVPVLDALAIGAGIITRSYGAANSIMILLRISDILQHRTLRKTRKALRKSLSRRINRVWLLQGDGLEVSVPLREIQPGDSVVVRTGALIAVDGTVTDGMAEVNEALMTGEAAPVCKQRGSRVYAGTTVNCGRLVVCVESVDVRTRIRRIVNMVEHADEHKALIQTDCEHLADRIVPWSLLAAGLTWVISARIGQVSAVLMVDYSCALKLTTPIVMATAMRQAVKHGVIVKGGKYLEAVAMADTIIFDKTGTLTTATPSVSRILALPPYSQDDVLRIVACIEEHFHHSMAQAIVKEARHRRLRHRREEHGEVQLVVARGVRTTVHGQNALVGSALFLFRDEGVEAAPELEAQINEGDSVTWLAIGERAVGAVCLRDTLRPEAAEVIRDLRALGLKNIRLLTGDTAQSTVPVAQALGITDYCTGMSPEQKAAVVCELRDMGHKIIMVGDGVNDSPAMTCAEAAVSMKDAADLAREVADITLLENSLSGLVDLRRLSVAALQRIHSNYRFIAAFNSALIAAGAFGVFPPLLSAWLHNLSTVGVCVTSRRSFE